MDNFNIFPLPDGGSYFGELNENGLPHSMDALGVWPDGKTYSGSWINGTITGVGTMYQHGEILHYGYWWKGELLHEFPIGDSQPEPSPNEQPSPQPQKKNKVAALLVGNNNYSGAPLQNCIKDTEAIGAELKSIGADVVILKNACMYEMKNAIEKVGEKASSYENVFFFFSGHGASNQGRHYLMSIDEKPISLEEIDKYFSSTNYKNIILVSDACTTIKNFIEEELEAPFSAGRTLMVFSSALNSSWDGIPGEHSPFAYGLLQYISKPMSVIDLFCEANKFARAYALNHEFYQQPNLLLLSEFSRELYLY